MHCGCRCNERVKDNTDGSKRLTYTGLRGELEHLMIDTRLFIITEKTRELKRGNEMVSVL